MTTQFNLTVNGCGDVAAKRHGVSKHCQTRCKYVALCQVRAANLSGSNVSQLMLTLGVVQIQQYVVFISVATPEGNAVGGYAIP